MCIQQRFKPVYASAQSDQNLSFPSEETLDPRLPIDHPSKTDQTVQNLFGGVLSYGRKFKISQILNFQNSVLKTCNMPTKNSEFES